MSCCCGACDRAAYAGKKQAKMNLKKKLVCLYRAITLALSSRKLHAQHCTIWLRFGFVFLYHCVGNCKAVRTQIAAPGAEHTASA